MIAFQRLSIRLFALWVASSGLLAARPAVAATTYSYISPNYTAAEITGTGTGTPPVYTTAMHFSGSFTTASPLPANMPGTDIGPNGSNLVQSWSFNDGLHDYSAANSNLITEFIVATDAAGNIQQFGLAGVSPLPPNTIGQKMDVFVFTIGTGIANVEAVSNAPCTTVSSGGCIGANSVLADSEVLLSQPGAISVVAPPSPFSLASSLDPSTVGQSVTFTASNAGSGTVTFADGSTPMCSNVAVAGGSATCATSSLAAGSHTINATYTSTGGATVVTATASLTQVVDPLPSPPAASAPTLGQWGFLILLLGVCGVAVRHRLRTQGETAVMRMFPGLESSAIRMPRKPGRVRIRHRLGVFLLATVAAACAHAADGFVATPPMPSQRAEHTATELSTKKVLLAGGQVPNGGSALSVATTALYDPSTNTWAAATPMGTARASHTATLLPGGKVLVVGGVNAANTVVASAELYDPVSGNWSPAAPMAQARAFHVAVLLGNGKVLVAGGSTDPNGYLIALSSAELYDPVSNTWSAAASMSPGRIQPAATLLSASGKVLVAGGYTGGAGGSFTTATQLYDPVADTWTSTGSMATGRTGHTATFVNGDGRVLVAGGQHFGIVEATAELYDPVAGTWTATGSMATKRHAHSASIYVSASKTFVLVAGGNDTTFMGALNSAELYDVTTGTWSPGGGSMTAHRIGHTATFLGLSNQKVLIAGGDDGVAGTLSSAELYGPVGAAGNVITVTSATNPSTVGQTVNFYVNVYGSAPSGTVTFQDGMTVLCANVTLTPDDTFNSTAGCSTSALTAGSHNITVVYGGDANNQGGTSAALVQVVNAGAQSPAAAPTLGRWGWLVLLFGVGSATFWHRRRTR